MNRMKLMAVLCVAACATGAYAQTSADATRNGSHVLQGDFKVAGTTPTFALDNGNSKRVGYGGATASARCNQPIWGLDLPVIPAGQTLSVATLTADVTSISGSPLFFEVLASLMTATDTSEFAADPSAYFVTETAPLDTVLANGIVFAQFAQADVPVGGTLEIPVTGAALDQLNSLYDPSGVPLQSTVWFRLSTSVSNDPAAYQGGDRIQFADGDSTSEAAFGLQLGWGAVPEFIADPVIRPNVTWGSDYASLSETLQGSATSSDGSSTVFYEKTGGPDWLVVATNGALSGIADVVGTNEFPIKAIVGDNFATATLQIVVDPLGNVPEFTNDVIKKADAVFGSDYADQVQTLDGSATDLDGDTLSYFKEGGPAWLNIASNGALSGVCNVLGTNTFPISVEDVNGNSDTAELVIFVQELGSAPEFTVDPIIKVDGKLNQDYALKSQTLEGSATDPDLDTLIYSKTGGPAWLNIASNGVLSGVAANVGTNSFTVQVDDGNGNSDTATLLINVKPLVFGDLIVGWDVWSSNTDPAASFTATDISGAAVAVASAGTWTTADSRGASADGTWGSHEGPPVASTNVATGECMELSNAKTDGTITFTVTNNGTDAIPLGYFHFDANAFRSVAARTFELSVLAGGGISEGIVYTSAEQEIPVGGPDNLAHREYDLSLAGLTDNTLGAGESVQFLLAFSGGAGDNSGGHDLWVDNVAISAEGGPEVPDTPTATTSVSGGNIEISWSTGGEFKLQTRGSLAFGDWEDVPGGTSASPISVPMTNDVEFLRLVWP